MSRLNVVDPKTATGKSKELLDAIQKKLGVTPNLVRGFANSPAVLQAYMGMSSGLAGGTLGAKLREQIALTVSQANECGYCLAAHSALGKSVGLSDEEVMDSRHASSTDSKVDAALQFARSIVEKRGLVSDDDMESVRRAGYDDGEISEIVANVALMIFTNYFNHVADVPVDFPEVEPLHTSV